MEEWQVEIQGKNINGVFMAVVIPNSRIKVQYSGQFHWKKMPSLLGILLS